MAAIHERRSMEPDCGCCSGSLAGLCLLAMINASFHRSRIKQSMDQELIDRIYESSLVPELWPGVLDELGRIAEGAGGTLWITKADVQYWTASPGSLERAAVVFNEGLFWRGQLAARTLAARHAGFLTGLDHFTPDEWDQEPLIRDFWRPQGVDLRGIRTPLWG
jgi:hypothetical protein